MYILGISAFYHDSAAALIKNGVVIAAAQEERFTRKKHDAAFPKNAIEYCLKQAGITTKDLECVTFYEKPFVKFDRLVETYLTYAPRGFLSFLKAMPLWLKEKIFIKDVIRKGLNEISGEKQKIKILFTEHHQSHAASAFFPSPYQKAAVLCLDGVGEWASGSVWLGEGNKLQPKWQINFPHSLGMLYSAFTYYTGFKVNSGEYKLMGLAPYGEPKYVDLILKHLIDLRDDGTFRINMKYFDYAAGLRMTNKNFHKLFGGEPRKPEDTVTQKEMDLARSIQVVTEEVVLRLARTIHSELGVDSLCMAGGVALNCVANGRLLREGPFKKIWIQPAAGDAGGAVGAALATWYQYFNNKREVAGEGKDHMIGSYLGPEFSEIEIQQELDSLGASYEKLNEQELYDKVADLLMNENVFGWFQGRMEFGPRALGNRSIIGDARSKKMQSVMNLKIKYRESFRPFAPAVLAEDVNEYFEFDQISPYMLMVANVQNKYRIEMSSEQKKLFGIEKLNVPRSNIPAITHVDYSARLQTVHADTNSKFYRLLSAFKKKTGCSVLVNTSFNVRGEPIVCSPADAYRCFMRTEMDYLVVGNFLLSKKNQKNKQDDKRWMKEFELD